MSNFVSECVRSRAAAGGAHQISEVFVLILSLAAAHQSVLSASKMPAGQAAVADVFFLGSMVAAASCPGGSAPHSTVSPAVPCVTLLHVL